MFFLSVSEQLEGRGHLTVFSETPFAPAGTPCSYDETIPRRRSRDAGHMVTVICVIYQQISSFSKHQVCKIHVNNIKQHNTNVLISVLFFKISETIYYLLRFLGHSATLSM